MKSAKMSILAVLLACGLVVLTTAAFPQTSGGNFSKPEKLLSGEKIVSFKTNDKLNIVGSLFYPKSYSDNTENVQVPDRVYPGVILFHMWQGNRYDWLPLIEQLQSENFIVLAIDLREHGDSQSRRRWHNNPAAYLPTMVNDAFAAYKFILQQPAVDTKRISAGGASIGATITILLAHKINSYNGKFPVLQSAFIISPALSYFTVNVSSHMKNCRTIPFLFLLDRHDPTRDDTSIFKSGNSMYLKFRGPKKVFICDGVGHGTRMLKQPQIINEITEWITNPVPEEATR